MTRVCHAPAARREYATTHTRRSLLSLSSQRYRERDRERDRQTDRQTDRETSPNVQLVMSLRPACIFNIPIWEYYVTSLMKKKKKRFLEREREREREEKEVIVGF